MNFVICTDSLSAINSILNVHKKSQHSFAKQIASLLQEIQDRVVLIWVPSHVGIAGNELVDKGAKEAMSISPIPGVKSPYPDFRLTLKSAIESQWMEEWRNVPQTNKLKNACPDAHSSVYLSMTNLRQQVVYCRLRTGHSALTHSFLLQKTSPPLCPLCDCPLSVSHLLVECPRYSRNRREIGLSTSLTDIFRPEPDAVKHLLDYVKKIGIYRAI